MTSSPYNSLTKDAKTLSNKTLTDGKTLDKTNELYKKHLTDFNLKNNEYIKQSKVVPELNYAISQLSAMDEDRGLVANQYRYNKNMWLIVCILVIFGIIKAIK